MKLKAVLTYVNSFDVVLHSQVVQSCFPKHVGQIWICIVFKKCLNDSIKPFSWRQMYGTVSLIVLHKTDGFYNTEYIWRNSVSKRL